MGSFFGNGVEVESTQCVERPQIVVANVHFDF